MIFEKLNGIIGSCIAKSQCELNDTVSVCSERDFGNKLGVSCYVGQFSAAQQIACQAGQYCQRSSIFNFLSGFASYGNCVFKCNTDNSYLTNESCCQTDLCNAKQALSVPSDFSSVDTFSLSSSSSYSRKSVLSSKPSQFLVFFLLWLLF